MTSTTAQRDEDVEVIIAHDHRYFFHKHMLASHSRLLAEMLSEKAGARLGHKAVNAGVKIKHVVALTEVPDFEKGFPGKLELLAQNQYGEIEGGFRGLVLNENGKVKTRAFMYYQSIFYSFYNPAEYVPISDSSMDSALVDACHILDIADYLQCVATVSKPIDVALSKRGQDLYVCIQSKPWAWISLAYRIKSELIFKEALIHLAGNWRKIKTNPEARKTIGMMPGQVRAAIEMHHKALVSKGKKLELAVASLYPGDISTPTHDFPIKREEYSKDILIWMALSWFRHWFAQKTIAENGSLARDGGYGLYKQLGKAGDAYMDKALINQFHQKFPMTKKALNVLENHLLEIKEVMKGIVERHGILKSYCGLDTARFPVDYLTCAIIDQGDLPWDVEKDPNEIGNLFPTRRTRDYINGGTEVDDIMAGGTVMDIPVRGGGRRMGGNEITRRNLEAERRLAEANMGGSPKKRAGSGFESDEEEDEEVYFEVVTPKKNGTNGAPGFPLTPKSRLTSPTKKDADSPSPSKKTRVN